MVELMVSKLCTTKNGGLLAIDVIENVLLYSF